MCTPVCIKCVYMLAMSPFGTQITGKKISEMLERMNAESRQCQYQRLCLPLPCSVVTDKKPGS